MSLDLQIIERDRRQAADDRWESIKIEIQSCRTKQEKLAIRRRLTQEVKSKPTLRLFTFDGIKFRFDQKIMGRQCEKYLGDEGDRDVRHVVYLLVDADGYVAYVGQTDQRLRHRLNSHQYKAFASDVYFIQASSRVGSMNFLESSLIRVLQPYLNQKTYPGVIVDAFNPLHQYGIDYKRSDLLCDRLEKAYGIRIDR